MSEIEGAFRNIGPKAMAKWMGTTAIEAGLELVAEICRLCGIVDGLLETHPCEDPRRQDDCSWCRFGPRSVGFERCPWKFAQQTRDWEPEGVNDGRETTAAN